jgi:hypothetical protein
VKAVGKRAGEEEAVAEEEVAEEGGEVVATIPVGMAVAADRGEEKVVAAMLVAGVGVVVGEGEATRILVEQEEEVHLRTPRRDSSRMEKRERTPIL